MSRAASELGAMPALANALGSEEVNGSEVKKIIKKVGSPTFAAWKDEATDQTILHKAILKHRADLIPCILEGAGQMANALLFAGQHGRTALNLAAYTGQVDCLRVLIDAAGNKRTQLLLARDGSGNTALHRAACSGNMECIRLLFAAAGDNQERLLMAKEKEGNTALHLAAMYDRPDCIRLLLELAGESRPELLYARDKVGISAMDWALSKGNHDCVSVLEAVAGFGKRLA